jgi:hypothetical protein
MTTTNLPREFSTFSLDQAATPYEDTTIRVTFNSSNAATILFPYDLRISTVRSPFAMEMNVSYVDPDGNESPGDLTGGSDYRRKPHFGSNEREVISQLRQFNKLYLKPSSAQSGVVYIYLGRGIPNEKALTITLS